MSFSGAIHTCDIQESTASTTMGEKTYSWSNVSGSVSVPCRLYRAEGGYVETNEEPEKFVEGWKLMLPYGQTVTVSNAIANVRDRRNNVLVTFARIKHIHPDPGGQFHHQELMLSEVKTH